MRAVFGSVRAIFLRGSVGALSVAWTMGGGAFGWFVQAASNVSSGLAIAACAAVGFVVALFVAFYNADTEREDLKQKLEEREKWLEVAHKLGEFGIEGKGLIRRNHPIAEWPDISDWKARLLVYVESRLGKGHRFLIESGAGNEPKPPENITGDERQRWIHIQARLIALKELVRETVVRAESIKP